MTAEQSKCSLKVTRVPISWRQDQSIFASEVFLSTIADEYGWIGGANDGGELRCVLPYTVIRKAKIRLIRFRVETIPLLEELSIHEEKAFLNSSISFFRSIGADVIIPATTNTVFRTFPDGAIAAPYGSYTIDLTQPEDVLWHNISHGYRKDIHDAEKKGVKIRSGLDKLDEAYHIIKNTFNKSEISFMNIGSFKRLLGGLGENVMLFLAESNGIVQSCAILPFSHYCAYGVYGGSAPNSIPGSFKLIQWEAIKIFREIGVQRFDLVGSRINPAKGSKQEGIMMFKHHFGARLTQGYIWKYPINRMGYALYQFAVRILRGGDIVDQERHKLIS